MATSERRTLPSTWEVAALAALAAWLVLPLLVVGATMLMGVPVDTPAPGEHYWIFVVAAAVVSPLAAPYGCVLGFVTMPLHRRLGAGYATAVSPSSDVDGAGDVGHVLAAILLAVLTTFAAVAVLATRSWLAGPGIAPIPGRVLANPAVSLAMLCLAGSFVAAPFLFSQGYRVAAAGALDGREVAVYAAYALTLLPSPLVALAVLDWLLSGVDIWSFVL